MGLNGLDLGTGAVGAVEVHILESGLLFFFLCYLL